MGLVEADVPVIKMQSKENTSFERIGGFTEILETLDDIKTTPATYMIVINRQLPRLKGESDILYFGHTKEGIPQRFGAYKGGNTPNEKHLRDCCKELEKNGDHIDVYVCSSPPENKSVYEYEVVLQEKFKSEHCELPPFNEKIG